MSFGSTAPIPTVAVTGVPDPLPEGLGVLDVREDVEWVHGHIAHATHIPLRELPARLSEVPEGQVLVVCKVGGRSAQAVGYLAHQGHDVVNLDGGMLEWEAAGRAMVSESGHPPQVV
jgi:rhodanese-related sulfurtransferase